MDKFLKPVATLEGDNSEVVAYVYGEPITQNQVGRKMSELSFLKGLGTDLSTPQKEALATSAKAELIRAALLRTTARYNDMTLPDTGEGAKLEMNLLASRFGAADDSFINVLSRQKDNPTLFTNMIAARLKQKELLEQSLVKTIAVPEKDLKIYYDEIKDKMAVPAHRQLSHIFLTTLDKDSAEVEQKAGNVLRQLKDGASFNELASRYSEDARTASKGGDLGIITEARKNLLKDIDLFSMPENTPVLKQSPLGWHIFLAGPVQPEKALSFEESLPILKPALYSMRRDRAVSLYMQEAMREAHSLQKIWNK